MRHTPMERFGWEQLVRRAELPSTTKLVALTLATFANPGGGRVRPGEILLADCCGLRERAVREHMALLRSLGLVEVVIEGRRGHASVYQLTIPAPDCAPLPMRLDPGGERLAGRERGRGGGKRETTGTRVPAIDEFTGIRMPVNNSMTGTGVPVDIADDRHPGADDPGNDRHLGAGLQAPGRTMTGTPTSNDRHPGASHHTDHTDQPRPTTGTLAGYVTYAADETPNTEQDHSTPGQPRTDTPTADPGLTADRPAFAPPPRAHDPTHDAEWRPRDTEFADARRTLDGSPRRAWALDQARMELAAAGHDKPTFRALTLHAAALITEGTP